MESKLLKIAGKYNVEITFEIRKSTIVSIIRNSDEIEVVKIGYLKNHIELVEETAKQMYEKQELSNRELFKDMNERIKNI